MGSPGRVLGVAALGRRVPASQLRRNWGEGLPFFKRLTLIAELLLTHVCF